jgi:Anti-sigma-K factor rskA
VALSDDQKAMLRLLAQREEGYGEMAAVMGISVEELRRRVKDALAEIDASAAPRSRSRRPRPRLLDKLPKDRGALIGLGAGALAVLVMAIVLIVSGDGSSSSSGPSTAGDTGAAGENLTEAILQPVSGGEAGGRALFGRYKNSVLLQVEAEGLEPAPAGEDYTVWLYRSPKLSLQIGSVPERDGKIAAQLQIPAQLLAYVASGAFNQVDVSLTPTAAYEAALAKAKAERKLPPHIGESVLRGEITGPAIRGR